MAEALCENSADSQPQPLQATPGKVDHRVLWGKLALFSAVLGLSLFWRPADEPRFNLCLFRAVTGLPCPGCGMTRAFCALSHGELLRAVHFNLLSPAVYLGFWLAWAHALASLLRLDKIRAALERFAPTGSFAKSLLVLVVIWWAARLIGTITN